MMHKAWSSIEEVPYCFSRSSVKFQGHTARRKKIEFEPNWAFPDCNSSFNSPMDTKWCTKLEAAKKKVPNLFWRSYVKLQSHTAQKTSNLTQIGRFRIVTPVWIHWWISNDTESLMLYERLALLFFGVIHTISRSHRQKFDDLNPIWVRLIGQLHPSD